MQSINQVYSMFQIPFVLETEEHRWPQKSKSYQFKLDGEALQSSPMLGIETFFQPEHSAHTFNPYELQGPCGSGILASRELQVLEIKAPKERVRSEYIFLK